MKYWIWLKKRRGKEPYVFEDSFLPGIRIPVRIEKMLKSDFVRNQFGFCDFCELASRTHPIDEDGSKFCTVFLHDALKPSWLIDDVV